MAYARADLSTGRPGSSASHSSRNDGSERSRNLCRKASCSSSTLLTESCRTPLNASSSMILPARPSNTHAYSLFRMGSVIPKYVSSSSPRGD
eukprot:347098-Hanusia_phi.AAC.1